MPQSILEKVGLQKKKSDTSNYSSPLSPSSPVDPGSSSKRKTKAGAFGSVLKKVGSRRKSMIQES